MAVLANSDVCLLYTSDNQKDLLVNPITAGYPQWAVWGNRPAFLCIFIYINTYIYIYIHIYIYIYI